MAAAFKIETGFKPGPQINVLMGVNKIGKTSWAAEAPNPVFLDLERGSTHLNVSRLLPEQISSFEKILASIEWSVSEGFQNIVLDSAEAVEALVEGEVCKENGWKTISQPGFGKGPEAVREYIRELMHKLQWAQTKGVGSIIIAHTQVKTITDPTNNESYDRNVMRMSDKSAAVFQDLANNLFFATYKVNTFKDQGKTKATGNGERVMYTEWRPAFNAGNRLNLPFELPLSYKAYEQAVENSKPKSPAELQAEIVEILKKSPAGLKTLGEQKLKEAGDSVQLLIRMKTHLLTQLRGVA